MSRLTRATQTVNWLLQDRAIRHALWLMRLRTAERNQILALLDREVYPAVRRLLRERLAIIERLGSDTGPMTTTRLAELERALRDVTSQGFLKAEETLAQHLADITVSESEWQVATLRSTVPVTWDFTMPNPVTLRALVSTDPMQGRLLADWWDRTEASLRTNIMSTLRVGVASGQTSPQIARGLIDATGGGPIGMNRRNVDAVVRTAVAEYSNAARQLTYRENDDIVKGWRFLATLDDRTTLICMGLDGREFATGDTQYEPPVHWGCRSTSVPILKSWLELGISLSEADPGTRASMNGQVPAQVTYGDWLMGQSNAFQDEVLGPARAELFRSGDVPIDRFTDDASRVLTLAELRQREGLPAEIP